MVDFEEIDLKTIFGDKLVIKVDKYNVTDELATIVDRVGDLSAKMQNLPRVVTTSKSLADSPNDCVYLATNSGCNFIAGILKLCRKNLYLYNAAGKYELYKDSPALSDFYVVQNMQRQGIGKLLFDFMLNDQDIQANRIAYDAPTDNLKGFCKKHYALEQIIPQANKFVVYAEFFEGDKIRENWTLNEKQRMSLMTLNGDGGAGFKGAENPSYLW